MICYMVERDIICRPPVLCTVMCVLLIRCSLGPGPGCADPHTVLFSSHKFKFLPADCQSLHHK